MRAANSHWASPEEKEHVEAVVHDYPQQPGESQLHYIRRIAVEAGLIADDEGIQRWPARELPPVPQGVVDIRLPYREPREPGEDDE